MAACVSFDFDGPSPYLWAHRGQELATVAELEQRRFGPRVGVWRILDVLGEIGTTATFFVPGAVAAAYPDAVAGIVAAGHEVGLHGYLHERVEELGADELAEVMDRSVVALRDAGAGGPFGYRSPSWEMTPAAWRVLRQAGIRYDSSLMGADVPYTMEGIVEVPVDWSLDDAVFYRFTPGTQRAPVPADMLAGAWSAELESARRFGTLVVLTMHPWMSGRAARADALRGLLRRYAGDPDIWWATVAEIAEHHAKMSGTSGTAELRPGEL